MTDEIQIEIPDPMQENIDPMAMDKLRSKAARDLTPEDMDILIAECRKDREKELSARSGRAKTRAAKKDPGRIKVDLENLDLGTLDL